MSESRQICSVPTIAQANNQVCKWEKSDTGATVTWGSAIQDGDLGELTREQVQKSITEALNRWEEVCGIRFEEFDDPSADITMFANLPNPGPGGTLADSELPCGPDRPLKQRYDRDERWGIFNNDDPSRIDLTRVICHEVGHAIGIFHIGSGNLLAPTYSEIIKPQTGDIAEAQRRYGPPRVGPDPPPLNPGTGTEVRLILRDDGLVGWKK